MIELQQNRYLWVHFAGLAFVPLLLDICLAGLASAGPALAFQGQFWAIALIGILPGLAMQCLKPFYIFSLPPSALRPSALSEDQRRCLQIFKSWQIKALAGVVAIFSLWILVQLYGLSPRVSQLLTPTAGLVSALVTFFVASTFMQISVSAARALLISPTALKRVAAVEESAIASDFFIPGIRVKKLLPDFAPPTESAAEPSTESVSEIAPAEPASTITPPTTTIETAAPETASATQSAEPIEADLPSPASINTAVNESVESTSESADVTQPSIENDDLEVVIPEKLPPEDNTEGIQNP